jgi:hypothetical protein
MPNPANPNKRAFRTILAIAGICMAFFLLVNIPEGYGCWARGGDVRIEGVSVRCYMDLATGNQASQYVLRQTNMEL